MNQISSLDRNDVKAKLYLRKLQIEMKFSCIILSKFVRMCGNIQKYGRNARNQYNANLIFISLN